MYDQFGESDLSYHELLTEFLQHLCERTRKGPPTTHRRDPAPSGTAPHAHRPDPAGGGRRTTGGHRHGRREPGTGGASRRRRARPERRRRAPPRARHDADRGRRDLLHDRPEHFTADLHTPPVVSLLTSTLPTSSRAGVQLSLSKISTVRMTVRRGGKVVWSNSATVERGKPKLLWTTPVEGRRLLGHAHGDRPGRQLRDRDRHDHVAARR